MISAAVIADSINGSGIRLTTIECIYPTFILPELNTHRIMSKSSASSRAIPIDKMIERVESNPAMPIYWGRNRSGMSADQEIHPDDIPRVKREWVAAMRDAIEHVKTLSAYGVHKQTANRLLMPFSHTSTIVTSTSWNHFFSLRRSNLAQPEMKALADAMWVARECSKPNLLDAGQWHTPYVYADEVPDLKNRVKVSAARCARVSYNNHNGTREIQKDLDLHDRLKKEGHFSPLEHQATPYGGSDEQSPQYVSNLGPTWVQYRKSFASEFVAG